MTVTLRKLDTREGIDEKYIDEICDVCGCKKAIEGPDYIICANVECHNQRLI